MPWLLQRNQRQEASVWESSKRHRDIKITHAAVSEYNGCKTCPSTSDAGTSIAINQNVHTLNTTSMNGDKKVQDSLIKRKEKINSRIST